MTAVRLTRRVFVDLSLWMTGLGLVIGLAFPFAIIPLGVPAEKVLRPPFFAATVAAGLFVGAANFALARRVVGRRLRRLSGGMRHVSEVLAQATYSGDWSRCSPQECNLEVDSEDELGDVAQSFNELLNSLAASRRVERAMTSFAQDLSAHLDVTELADAALRGLIEHGGADAGALCLVRDGELAMQAWHRLDPFGLCESLTLKAAVRQARPTIVEIPPDVVIEAGVVAFRPAAVVVLPIGDRDRLLSAVLLAFAAAPSSEAVRLLESLRGTVAVALTNALAHQRIQQLAACDPLTELYNRRFGLQRLDEELARARRESRALGVLALDLDHFKAVNDQHGHAFGDRVLVEVAQALVGALREEDVVVRMGGEEFLAILPGADRDATAAAAERVRVAMTRIRVIDQVALRVTTSVGGVSYPEAPAETAGQLLLAADRALYAAKGAGRDRVHVHADA